MDSQRTSDSNNPEMPPPYSTSPGKANFYEKLSTWWTRFKPLIAAKNSLDDQYNFASGSRSSWGGRPYNFPGVARRGEEE